MSNSLFKIFGHGLCAAGLISFACNSAAWAADVQDHNSSRSNKSSSSAAPDGSSGDSDSAAKISAITMRIPKIMEEIESLRSSMSGEMATMHSLLDELESLSTQLTEAEAASAEEADEMLSQIDEAQRAFSESVAPFLSPEVVSAVSSVLDSSKSSLMGRKAGEKQYDYMDSFPQMTESLVSMQGFFDIFVESCRATGEHIKEAKLFTR